MATRIIRGLRLRRAVGPAMGCVCLGLGSAASGQTVSTETSFGVQTGTLDFRQGLEFLDVPLSFGISWAQMQGVGLQTGATFEGWRFATPQEVNGLFVTGNVVPNDGVYMNHMADGVHPELFDMMQLVGFFEFDTGHRITHGWTSETMSDGATFESRVGVIEIVPGHHWMYGTGLWRAADGALPTVGSWLVRERPGCRADVMVPFGTLNFFDVVEYLSRYSDGDAAADIAEPIGTLNFFDIAEYIALYNLGC